LNLLNDNFDTSVVKINDLYVSDSKRIYKTLLDDMKLGNIFYNEFYLGKDNFY
jgi:hypothetical protein